MATSALIGGAAAGLVSAALHLGLTVPLIAEAELYESGARVHVGGGAAGSPTGGPGLAREPLRHLLTAAFDVVAFVAYGLILTAIYGLAEIRGMPIGARSGLAWGLAGFVAVQLAPAAGLAPELPGIEAALGARQLWWTGTVLATAGGIALIVLTGGWYAIAGVALILVPHVIGAPQPDIYTGTAPPELAARFAARSLATAAAAWAVLGWATVLLYTRKEA